MDNTASIAGQLKAWLFGAPSDGVSIQTKRALLEAGVLMPESRAPQAEPEAPVVGGPSPSAELLERVRRQGEERARLSLQRLLEKRRREGL